MTFSMMLIPILGAISAFLFAISLIPSQSPLDQTLNKLRGARDDHDVPSGKLEAAISQLISSRTRGSLQVKLIQAGMYTVTPSKMFIRSASTMILGAAIALLLLRFMHLPFYLVAVFCVLSIVIGAYVPFYYLERAREHRLEQVQKTLPDFLDMLASTVRAGLAMNAAIVYAVDAAPGALGEEIQEALAEIRLGRGRSDALKAAAERLNQPQFTITITAINQAERLGTNISEVLLSLAEDVRHQRVTLVEEQAQRLPVKLAFPMAFCMLPTLFTIIFGTLAANYLAQR